MESTFIQYEPKAIEWNDESGCIGHTLGWIGVLLLYILLTMIYFVIRHRIGKSVSGVRCGESVGMLHSDLNKRQSFLSCGAVERRLQQGYTFWWPGYLFGGMWLLLVLICVVFSWLYSTKAVHISGTIPLDLVTIYTLAITITFTATYTHIFSSRRLFMRRVPLHQATHIYVQPVKMELPRPIWEVVVDMCRCLCWPGPRKESHDGRISESKDANTGEPVLSRVCYSECLVAGETVKYITVHGVRCVWNEDALRFIVSIGHITEDEKSVNPQTLLERFFNGGHSTVTVERIRRHVGMNSVTVPKENFLFTLGKAACTPFVGVIIMVQFICIPQFVHGGETLSQAMRWAARALQVASVVGVLAFRIYVSKRQLAMKKELAATEKCVVEVLRDGKWQFIDSEDIVPGDIFSVPKGKVPCDGILIAHDLVVDEAVLTG